MNVWIGYMLKGLTIERDTSLKTQVVLIHIFDRLYFIILFPIDLLGFLCAQFIIQFYQT